MFTDNPVGMYSNKMNNLRDKKFNARATSLIAMTVINDYP